MKKALGNSYQVALNKSGENFNYILVFLVNACSILQNNFDSRFT